MNWLGVVSLIVLLSAMGVTWWSVEGYLAEPVSAFKYEGNPLTFIWSSKKGGLELTLKTLAKLSDEGKLPPGVSHRTGLIRLFLYLVTASLVISLLLTFVALIFEWPEGFLIAALFSLLALAFYELAFISAEIPRSFMMTFGDDYWIRWQERSGKFVDILATILLASAGVIGRFMRDRRAIGPRRPPRRRGRYWW